MLFMVVTVLCMPYICVHVHVHVCLNLHPLYVCAVRIYAVCMYIYSICKHVNVCVCV